MDNNDTATVEWPNFGEALRGKLYQFHVSDEYGDITPPKKAIKFHAIESYCRCVRHTSVACSKQTEHQIQLVSNNLFAQKIMKRGLTMFIHIYVRL